MHQFKYSVLNVSLPVTPLSIGVKNVYGNSISDGPCFMTFLHLVAYGATAFAFCLVLFSVACGLYYLAELVEEYTVYTRKVIKVMTVTVIVIHVLLWVIDRLPFLLLLFSALCHGVYTLNLKTFPFISLTSVPFLASCVLVFADHFLWFQYFTVHYRPFMDIASFFGICVWLMPFTYFISLSANDNALPMTDPSALDSIPSQHKKGLFRSVFSFFDRKTTELPAVTSDLSPSSVYDNASYTAPFGAPSDRPTSPQYPYAQRTMQRRKVA